MRVLILLLCLFLIPFALSAQDSSLCEGQQYDVDGDNVVGVGDVLSVLSWFGTVLDADQDGTLDCNDDCVGVYDECGVCNGPGPQVQVLDTIIITYDSIYVEAINDWVTYELGADSVFTLQCEDPGNFNACGDSLEYWGAWYQTTQIGDQCWFAENLATLRYQNGDSIYAPTESSDWYDPMDWDNGIGATCTIGQFSDLPCYELGGSLNACNPDESLYELGRLYNWFAIIDDRNCCPSGWNVPSSPQVYELRDWLSANGFEGEEGRALKSTVGWRQFSASEPPGNGTDDFGFTAYPAGWLAIGGGNFQFESIGSYGFFWRRSFGSPGNYSRYGFRLETYNQEFEISAAINTTWGGTVRCIKD